MRLQSSQITAKLTVFTKRKTSKIDKMAETEIEGRFIEVNFGRLEISKERSKHVTFSRPFTDVSFPVF